MNRTNVTLNITTMHHIEMFGRACPSMLCHIILGFGRAWKGIVVGMPFPKHEIMFGRAFIREGHALPNRT